MVRGPLLALVFLMAALSACGDGKGESVATESAGDARPQSIGATASSSATIFEAVPGLCEAVDPHDAAMTQTRLQARGFRVTWMLLDLASGDSPREVDSPPAGAPVISVLSEKGEYQGVAGTTKDLLVEVARDPGDHPVGRDAACG